MKLSLGDYSQRGVKKQTSKQKETPGWCPWRTSALVPHLWWQCPPKINSLGRFHITRLYLHPLFKKTKETSQVSKKRDLVPWCKRLIYGKASPGTACGVLLGLCPFSGPALLSWLPWGSGRVWLCCSGLILTSQAEPGKPALPLQGLHRAGEQSWALSVSGSKQGRQRKRREKKKKDQEIEPEQRRN